MRQQGSHCACARVSVLLGGFLSFSDYSTQAPVDEYVNDYIVTRDYKSALALVRVLQPKDDQDAKHHRTVAPHYTLKDNRGVFV